MRIRAMILIMMLIGGAYMMIQSTDPSPKNVSSFATMLDGMNSSIHTVTFIKPNTSNHGIHRQTINQSTQIQDFLIFLENYRLQAIESIPNTGHEQFTILLEDEQQNIISILLEENLVTVNDKTSYKIVNGPLDIEWLATFFFQFPS